MFITGQPVTAQPDITQNDLQATLSAANTVTNYAQATITAVPRIPQPPSWYLPMSQHLQAAQSHAQDWISNICPAVANGVPQSIISFSGAFSDSCTQLINLMQAIGNEPGSVPTPAQRSNAEQYLSYILTAVNDQQTAVAAMKKSVDNYAAELNSDQQTLAADLDVVVSKFTSGQASANQMTAAIGERFLDSTVLGPCSVIVSIDMNISLKVSSLNLDPTIITTVYAKAILENQTNNTQAAQRSIQTLVDAWNMLQQKYTTVIGDLKDAAGDQYMPALIQLDLQTAKVQWKQLADFAQTLLNQ